MADAALPEAIDPDPRAAAVAARRTRGPRVVALGLVLVQLALLLHAAWRVGPTFDEHYYATAGLSYWRDGRLSFNREHPPLGKYLIGLPLALSSDVDWDEHSLDRVSPPIRFFFQAEADDLDRNLFRARLPSIALVVLASLLVYRLGEARLGPLPGLVGLTAFAFNPNVLAQGPSAALDGILMVAFFVSVWTFVRLFERPGAARALVAAIAFGAAALVKFTSLLLVPAFVLLAAFSAVRRRSLAPLLWTGAVFLGGFGVFSAGYGFEAISLNEACADKDYATGAEGDDPVEQVFTQPILRRLVGTLFGDERPVPLLSALKGLDYQLNASRSGHPSVYRGRPVSAGDLAQGNPHPEYYAVVLAIKNPLPWLVLVGVGVFALVRNRRLSVPVRLAFVGVPLVVLLVFSGGKALMGARYVLPIFPFCALWGAGAAVRWPRLAGGLAGLGAILALRVHPHSLMYYSLLVGDRGPSISVVSDDWGQGVRTVGAFYQRNRDAIELAGGLHYEPYTAGDPRAFGLDALLPVPERGVRGIVCVHALSYWRDVRAGTRHDRKYAWLDDHEPFLVVDRSVYVFDTRSGAPGSDPGWR